MTEKIVEMYETIAQPIRKNCVVLKAQKKKKFQKTIFYLPEQKKRMLFKITSHFYYNKKI